MSRANTPPSAPRLLEVSHLHVAAGSGQDTRTIVRDVSFTLAAGQTLGIVGESGSGKSMTVKSVAGLLPAGVSSSGGVTFDGAELDHDGRAVESLRGSRISLLMQDPFTMLNPLYTAGRTLAESVTAKRRMAKAPLAAEVERRLAEVGLPPEVARKYPFQLSGGMRQRVAIAAAIAQDPDLLLADEPTTALDATTQADILRLLKQLQADRGMALLLITHDLRVAFDVCDRVQVMYAGSLVESAPVVTLSGEPRHPYTLGLLSSDLSAKHYQERLRSIPGSVPRPDSVAGTCAFAQRCEWAIDACSQISPPMAVVAPSHEAACIRIPDIAAELSARFVEVHDASPVPTFTPVGAPILEVRAVSKTYTTSPVVGRPQRTEALKEVSLTVNPGEAVGLVGESGSGKTTLSRTVLGLEQGDSGQIVLDGIDLSNRKLLSRPDKRRAHQLVQAVFQDPYSSLNPSLTIGSVLEEAISFRSPEMPRTTAIEALADVGLPSSYASRRPSSLSGGERQRVAIARAVSVRPKLLICDEPVAALDVSVQAQVLELLRDIREEFGIGLLFITHDLAVVRQMTDRVVVLFRGDVVEDGTTPEVLDRPTHSYTQRLVASSTAAFDAVL